LDLQFTEFTKFDEGGSDDDAPPILILHGLFGSGRNWAMLAKALSARKRVLALDLPNHGGSPWTPETDYQMMAGAVADFMAAKDIPAATILGHSMGGKTAMALALSQPQLIDRLIVVDIAPVEYAHDNLSYIDALQSLALDGVQSRGQADDALAEEISDAALRAFFLTNLARTGGGFEWRVNLAGLKASLAALHGFPEGAELEPFSGPALFIAGGASNYIVPEYYDAMERLFPGHQLATIDGAGHWVHADTPDALARVVLDFI